MGEVHQSGRPEDQREADGGHPEHQAEADPLDAEAHEALETRGHVAAAEPGGQREQHGPGAPGAHLEGEGGALLVLERDALGQRVGIDRDGVPARTRQRDLPLTILVAGDGVDLLAVGTLDGDVHALGEGILPGLGFVAQRPVDDLAAALVATGRLLPRPGARLGRPRHER